MALTIDSSGLDGQQNFPSGGTGVEAIILAGGFGTRLQSIVSHVPKCMAPVAGKPFLHYVISYFQKQGVEKFILSLGYKHAIIEQYLDNELKMQNPRLTFQLSIEKEPLGTGGAIKLACEYVKEQSAIIINGDTFFKINLHQLISFHKEMNSDCTICLKPMKNFNRYGVVELNNDNSIKSFSEKKFYTHGLINGGVYALNPKKFLIENVSGKFSFEKDYLEKFYSKNKFTGLVQDDYFIDIGIPEDYERAQTEILNVDL
jgi:D-glycero-alpha-D-manno-heptose 1-phosphate guanylyltransferase